MVKKLHKVDKAKMKKSHEEQQFGSGIELWKPDKNKQNSIYICPPWTDEEPDAYSYYKEASMHWGVPPNFDDDNNVALRCSKDFGNKCYSCAKVAQMRMQASSDKEKEMAGRCSSKSSYYVSVIDLDNIRNEDNTLKIQVWRAGWVVWNRLQMLMDDFGDFTDPEECRPLKIRVTTKKQRIDTHVDLDEACNLYSTFKITEKELVEALPNLTKLDVLIRFMKEVSWDEQKIMWKHGRHYKVVGLEDEEEEEAKTTESEEEEDEEEEASTSSTESPFFEEDDEEEEPAPLRRTFKSGLKKTVS